MIVAATTADSHGTPTAARLRRKANTCRRAADALDRWKPALANEYLADAAAFDRLADDHERLIGAARPAPFRPGR